MSHRRATSDAAPDRTGSDDRGDDRGVATVWTATAVAVLVVVLAGLLQVVGAVAARHRAEAAADLAALAAAGQAVQGPEVACARAAAVAATAGGRVALCRVHDAEALVEVEVAFPAARGGGARGRARAGPAAGRPDAPAPDPRDGPPP